MKGLIGKERVLQEKRGSSMTGCMSMKSAPEEKMAAESFVSSFPYFVRVMKKFNVSGSYTLVSICLLKTFVTCFCYYVTNN